MNESTMALAQIGADIAVCDNAAGEPGNARPSGVRVTRWWARQGSSYRPVLRYAPQNPVGCDQQ
jgi:hypothetical protein